MKKTRIILLITALLLVIFILGKPVAQAALEALEVNWWTVDSGGGQSAGDDIALQGVAGQPDAGILRGGGYTLAGGYLSGVIIPPQLYSYIYLPLVNK